MKKLAVGVIVLAFLVGCSYFDTIKERTETMVISYETIGTIAFPTVLAYLQAREQNGSLAGADLTKAKSIYASAKEKYLRVGDAMIKIVEGQPTPMNQAMIAVLLRETAVLLANLSGGKVEGNTLTVPKVGGK